MMGLTKISKVMQRLLTGYAVNFNIRYQRTGHLFQNRYKSILCKEETYFLRLVRYIHLNPVRAGLVRTPQDLASYPWTGHAAVLETQRNSWQDVNGVLGRFGSNRATAIAGYERFVLEGWEEPHRDELEGGGLLRSLGGVGGALAAARDNNRQMSDVRVLGDGDFVEEVLRQADIRDQANNGFKAVSLEMLMQKIAKEFKIDARTIQLKRRERKISKAKSILIFAAVEWLGKPLKEIAALTKMSAGCASRAMRRGQVLAEQLSLAAGFKRQ